MNVQMGPKEIQKQKWPNGTGDVTYFPENVNSRQCFPDLCRHFGKLDFLCKCCSFFHFPTEVCISGDVVNMLKYLETYLFGNT